MDEINEIQKQQPVLTDYFANVIMQEHLAHAYLLTGPKGIGKRTLALWVTQGIFCQNKTAGSPCLNCEECRRIASGNHPDVVHVAPDGLSIKVEQIRFLKSEFSKSGVEGNQKVFIIEDADKMTVSAANGLLKFLEEPSGNVVAFLLTESVNRILPTIVSRCQLFELAKPTSAQLTATLRKTGVTADKAIILGNLADSSDEAKKIATNEDFDKLVQNVCVWYLHVLQDDARCFVEVQMNLMPLVNNKDDEVILLNLIILLVKNSISVYYGEKDNIFVKFQADFTELIEKLTAEKVTEAVELVLATRKRLMVNVSFQNVIEALTIDLSQCYHS
ncbi:DNA polymerase III subunit delta' [Liquorilactobacillus hordei]|uniref:DNA polymerase III subunit delta n=1 Tax=Liquorilactobacillus hordei DSM 19519 TaxID=1423759 RepID=A0A0R1MFC5_9LACO|nr:DNA polymerase III subunit delta' [Liquorilactobacillus hordei]KRL06561.1 DNA polymerase III subunit delta [Liquorilactobacillus hordei DSM 19519]QYH51951.1 DNA polymerase III subunit delta' [Liquorilactobacillus hordei DSM 19519]